MSGRALVRLYANVSRPDPNSPTDTIIVSGFVFTTSQYTIRFLTIPADSPFLVLPNGFPLTRVVAHNRVVIRIDAQGTETATTTAVVSHERAIAGTYGRPGSKTAVLITGRREGRSFNQISFRFPGFVTVREISDILQTLIPDDKISSTPTTTQIRPFFRLKGGRTYPIMSQAAAVGDPEANPGFPALPPGTP